MIKFVSYKGRLYRLLMEVEGFAWVSDWEKNGAPIRIGNTSELIQENVPEEFLDETIPSKKREATMESRLKIIEPLIDEPIFICNPTLRSKKILEISKAHGISSKTVTRFYFAYLAKGKRGLLPAKRTQSDKKSESSYIDEDMQKAIKKYYYSPKKLSLYGAYEMYLLDYWKGENGRLQKGYPDFARFQRNYRKIKNGYRGIISRQGIGDYQKNYRPLLGSANDRAPNCGTFEMDATEADICIVSKYSRKPIGRPVVYLAVDVATRLITGIYVGLSGGSDAILQCLRSTVEDKVSFCKKYGIDISAKQWPSIGLPQTIVTDKGRDFMSGRVKELCERFEIEITNLPAYRPDLKGCVEKAFDCLQERYKPMLRGYGTIEVENTREGAMPVQTKACLDLSEYTRILLRCVIYYNSSRVVSFQREPQMISDGVQPVSSNIWEWMVKMNRANLISANTEDIFLMLLPRATGSITRQGLVFDGLHYDSEELDMTREYVEAGITGRRKVTVAYQKENAEQIFLVRNGRYYKFVLTSASAIFSGISFEEVKLMRKEENKVRKEAEKTQARDAAMCSDFIRKTALNAEKTKPHSRKDVTLQRMKQEKEKEKKNATNN